MQLDGNKAAEPGALPSHPMLWSLCCGLICLALSVYSIFLSRHPDSAAVVWYANGFMMAVLALNPYKHWPALIASAALATFSANLIWGDNLVFAGMLTFANVSTFTLGGLALSMASRFDDPFINLGAFKRFAIFSALLAPLSGTLIGSAAVSYFADVSFQNIVPVWYLGDVIGVLATAPFTYLILQRPLALPSRPEDLKPAFYIALFAIIAAWVMIYSPYPFVSIAVVLAASGILLNRIATFATLLIVSVATDFLLINHKYELTILYLELSMPALLLPITVTMLLGTGFS